MCKHEMEGGPAALPQDGVDHLGERTGGDEPSDRLVLEVRLRPDL